AGAAPRAGSTSAEPTATSSPPTRRGSSPASGWPETSARPEPMPHPSSAEPDTDARDLDAFRRDVLRGLASSPRCIPSKYFYDERGSQLFVAITETEEYYPTRTEQAIMDAHV